MKGIEVNSCYNKVDKLFPSCIVDYTRSARGTVYQGPALCSVCNEIPRECLAIIQYVAKLKYSMSILLSLTFTQTNTDYPIQSVMKYQNGLFLLTLEAKITDRSVRFSLYSERPMWSSLCSLQRKTVTYNLLRL